LVLDALTMKRDGADDFAAIEGPLPFGFRGDLEER
jgi:hypothetical protein